MSLTRETIIALRARHQAYRIASDILYPHVDVPPPPQPAIPPIEGPICLPRTSRKARRETVIAAAVIWAWVLIFWLVRWLWLNKG